MPKKTKLITVPQINNDYKGLTFNRWDSFVANFIKDHPDRKDTPTANNKQKRKKK